jgi:hypothetical protein
VIKKPCERGGHSLRWAAEPEKKNVHSLQTETLLHSSLSLAEMVGELFLPHDMPEAPKEGFFKGLFGGGVRSVDREELCKFTASVCQIVCCHSLAHRKVADRGCSPSDVDGMLTSGAHPSCWFGMM